MQIDAGNAAGDPGLDELSVSDHDFPRSRIDHIAGITMLDSTAYMRDRPDHLRHR